LIVPVTSTGCSKSMPSPNFELAVRRAEVDRVGRGHGPDGREQSQHRDENGRPYGRTGWSRVTTATRAPPSG
jgi:hypothetical protein